MPLFIIFVVHSDRDIVYSIYTDKEVAEKELRRLNTGKNSFEYYLKEFSIKQQIQVVYQLGGHL